MSTPQNSFDPENPQQPPQDGYRYPEGTGHNSQGNQGYQGYQSYGVNPAATGGYAGYSDPVGGPGAGWAMDAPRNSVAPWALGISILGLVMALSLLATAFAIVAGLIGLVLGIIAVVKARKTHGPDRRMGMSVSALVLSVITIVLSILFWVVVFAMVASTGIADCMTITDATQQQLCIEESLSSFSG